MILIPLTWSTGCKDSEYWIIISSTSTEGHHDGDHISLTESNRRQSINSGWENYLLVMPWFHQLAMPSVSVHRSQPICIILWLIKDILLRSLYLLLNVTQVHMDVCKHWVADDSKCQIKDASPIIRKASFFIPGQNNHVQLSGCLLKPKITLPNHYGRHMHRSPAFWSSLWHATWLIMTSSEQR